MNESRFYEEEIGLPADRAAARFLQSMPPGCTLETTTRLTERGWEATACLEHITDSPKPNYAGRGATEAEALLAALRRAVDYWSTRKGSSAIYPNDKALTPFLHGIGRATGAG